MKISAQEEYGLRCLLQMASRGVGASLSIPEISRGEGLSTPNVAKLMRLLRIRGFVVSARGQSGGYTLSRPPAQITISSVLEALGGRLFGPNFCTRHAGLAPLCAHVCDCSIRSVWSALQIVIEGALGQMTLGDLLVSERQMAGWMAARVYRIESSAPATAQI